MDDETLFNEIISQKTLVKETESEHRWYDIRSYVVEFRGIFIKYFDYHITGDNSAYDMGLSDMSNNTVIVHKKQKTIDYFE